MSDSKEILSDFVHIIKTDVVNSMQSKGRYASGQTAKEIEASATSDTASLSAPDYIDHLEDGRGPTSVGAKPADPTLYERINQWCSIKGIDQKAAYAITRSIHKYGYKGKPGVLTEPLGEDNINRRLNVTLNQLSDNEVDNILSALGL